MSLWSRRDALRMLTAGVSVSSLSGWFPALAQQAAGQIAKSRACILLWMPGGPSQLDTFDLKPGHANAGEFKPIDTSVAGIQISEIFPNLAKQAEHLAIVRSMKTKEGDHGRASYHLRTGYRPGGPLQYPTLGSLIAQEYPANPTSLPSYISILSNPFVSPGAFGPGFLGPRCAPLLVGNGNGPAGAADAGEYGAPLEVRNIRLTAGVDAERATARMDLLTSLDQSFAQRRPGLPTESHGAAYQQAHRMISSTAMQAFNLDEEPAALREKYGKNRFGQGCLLARRLVEQGIPFVEVALNGPDGNGAIGWDTHQGNFATLRTLGGVLDPAWSTLLEDLHRRGLLETTTVVWMGEFGRTPVINPNAGRDHFPNAWSVVLSGGGVRGGQVLGKTSESGMEVEDRPVAVNQLMATILASMGVDHTKQNMSQIGRPIRLAEPDVEPVRELLRT